MMQSGKYRRGLRQSVDWWIIFCYLALVLFGLLNIYASIQQSEPSSILDPASRSGKQFIWMMISFGLAALILFVLSPRIWEVVAAPGYGLIMLLLIAVIFLGVQVKGSRSWFEFGPVRFQPAEVSKITTSLMLALVMSQQNFKMTRLADFIKVAAIILVPMLVIVGESETGSALVYVGYIFMLYREGLSGWFIVAIGVAILLFILTLKASPIVSIIVLLVIVLASYIYTLHSKRRTHKQTVQATLLSVLAALAGLALTFSTQFLFNHVLQDHQRGRIEVLLGLKDDPAGVGYNVNQSMIAIGSGGLFGKGYLNGTQTTFGFVPEQSTDFIFCTVGEEWGFFGCLGVILVYVILIWRILTDAEKSREAFTRIYGYCVACCIFMHLFINIGMTIGLMPVIGIPLPLVSYGGSSLLAFTVLLFIFVALDHNEKKYF